MFQQKYYSYYVEHLDKSFPYKNTLSKGDIIAYDGRSRNTVYKDFPELKNIKGGISKVKFAMMLAKRDSGG